MENKQIEEITTEQENQSQTENNQKEELETRIINTLLQHLDAKWEAFDNNISNRFVALSDDIHQRLDRQDDTISTTNMQNNNKREGVF